MREYMYFVGDGAERVEEYLREQFPAARIARLDRDTVRTKREYQQVLGAFAKGEIDILVGTQMVAKGHDFQRVTLVGVVAADLALGRPDFRAAERTFQLLTQVAGRAGRGELSGEVLVETYYPEHYAIQYAAQQDYVSFYEKEAHFRRMLHYPPFTALANVLVRDRKIENAIRWSRALAAYFAPFEEHGVKILGPAAAPLARLRRDYRFQFVLKSPHRAALGKALAGGTRFLRGERNSRHRRHCRRRSHQPVVGVTQKWPGRYVAGQGVKLNRKITSATTAHARRAGSSGCQRSNIGGCRKRRVRINRFLPTRTTADRAAQRDQHDRHDDRNPAMPLARQAVDDVSAVELPHGQQIQRGGEKPHPRRAPHWVQQHPPRVHVRVKQRDEEFASTADVPKTIAALSCAPGTIFDVAMAKASAGTATTNPATGPDSPTSKSARRVVIGERMRMNAPNVPKSVGAGMKVRIAHVDAVNLAGEVVPQSRARTKSPAA